MAAQENFAGDLGVGSDPGLIRKIKEADLILALGSRLGDAVTQGYTLLDMAGAVPIIQVLPEGSDIGRVFRPALGIVSDLNVFAHAVAALDPVDAVVVGVDPRSAIVAGGATRGAELRWHAEPRHGDARAGNHADAGCHRHHRRRQLRRLGHAVPELFGQATLHRTDQRRDGLLRSRRHRGLDRLSRTHGRSAWSATAAS